MSLPGTFSFLIFILEAPCVQSQPPTCLCCQGLTHNEVGTTAGRCSWQQQLCVCVHEGLEGQHCQPKDSTVPRVGHPGSTHGGKCPGSSEMRGCSANPILNPTGAPQLRDASSCSLQGGCAGLMAAISVTLGGLGACLGGGQAELEGCERSGSTGLSPPASL